MHSSQRLQSSRLQIVSLKTGRFISFSRRIPDTPLGVSKNNGTPKSSILLGFSIINHPFCGTPIFGPPPPPFLFGTVSTTYKRKNTLQFAEVFFARIHFALGIMFVSWVFMSQFEVFPKDVGFQTSKTEILFMEEIRPTTWDV